MLNPDKGDIILIPARVFANCYHEDVTVELPHAPSVAKFYFPKREIHSVLERPLKVGDSVIVNGYGHSPFTILAIHDDRTWCESKQLGQAIFRLKDLARA